MNRRLSVIAVLIAFALSWFAAPAQAMYDPATGRFNRLDPWAGNVHDPQSLHKYAYAHNAPTYYTDPSGLTSITEINISVAIGSGVVAGLLSPNIANAPSSPDSFTHPDASGALVYDLFYDLATLGTGRLFRPIAARFILNPLQTARPSGKALQQHLHAADASSQLMPSIAPHDPNKLLPSNVIRDPARLLPQRHLVTRNRERGLAFQASVLESLRAPNGQRLLAPDGRVVVTDLPAGNLFAFTEIKDVKNLTQSRQFRAMMDMADHQRMPFNLIISRRTETVSEPLQRRISQTGGVILVFDDASGVFRTAQFAGNRVQ